MLGMYNNKIARYWSKNSFTDCDANAKHQQPQFQSCLNMSDNIMARERSVLFLALA